MNKKFNKALFIFRRDMRLDDNTGLISLLEQAEQVIPAFIFDPVQTDPSKNKYFSEPAFHFMINSLKELDLELRKRRSKLFVFSGKPAEVIKSLTEKDSIEAVFVNRDYTPFSIERDNEIARVCKNLGLTFSSHSDTTLSPIEDIRTGADNLYTVFTPFKKNAARHLPEPPGKNSLSNYFSESLECRTVSLDEFSDNTDTTGLILKGGRAEGLELLTNNDYLYNYKEARDIPAEKGTSQLSAHHKFGTISIRETFYASSAKSGPDSQFISELYWRDFYYYIALHFPHVFKRSFLDWAEYIEWINDAEQFQAWCDGTTGVPIVDAGMRELNQTGWMHNRVRMITASFLTKNLLIDWRWGEKYFAKNLIDYDPAQNNGGWQWSASTGADPRPLRIFNPYTQAKKYDPNAEYIQKWVPELKGVETKKLCDGKTRDFSLLSPKYPSPIADQKECYHRARAVYKEAKDKWRAAEGQ